MTLEPLVVGSIKDRILCAVWALGERATPSRLIKSVDCSNGSILSIAIEALQRDGYMYLSEGGCFVVHEDLVASMPKERTPTVAQTVSTARPQSREAADMAQKDCIKCLDPKDATEANFGKDKRTEDGLGKTCSECKRAAQSKPRPRKSAAPKSNGKAEPTIADEIVIPATGQIHCRALPGRIGFSIQQGNDQITCSYEQLQAMRDWASSQLKKAAA